MNARSLFRLPALGMLLFVPAVCAAQTQEVMSGPGNRLEDWKDLQTWVSPRTVVDMKKFQETMTLKDALSLCFEQLSKNGFKAQFVVSAFKEELSEEKRDFDILETKVRYTLEPRYVPASVFLRMTLNQIAGVNATYVIRDKHVEITTVEAAKFHWMLPTLAVIEKPPSIPTGEIRRMLGELIETKDLQFERPLREVLALLTPALSKKKHALQFVIDHDAFRKDDPDAGNIEETPIEFWKFPRKASVYFALRFALSKVATNYATMCVRSGQIVITTSENSKTFFRDAPLYEANFNKRPLTDAMDELAEQSGATIIVDSRVWQQAQTRVTGRFNAFKVETAVRLLADMAGLKPVLVDNVIYVTSPENARQFQATAPAPFFSPLYGETFKNRPLAEVLRALVPTNLVIDARVEKKTHIPVTAKFINEVELETALRLLTDMAGLSYVVVDNVVYVTAPENARRLEQEDREKMRLMPKVP